MILRKRLLAASTAAALALAMPGAHAATIGSTPSGATPERTDYINTVTTANPATGNGSPPGSPGYFVTLGSGSYSNVDTTVDGITPGSGQWAIIALDDGGSPDDNHDDLVVRLSLTGGSFAVPEPSTYLLMVSGLLALGFMARRRIG